MPTPPPKPSLYLNWTNGMSPMVTQPPASLQTSGWVPGVKPPPDFLNWLFWLTDSWIQWLDYEIENVLGNAAGTTANSVVLSTTGTMSIGSNQLTGLASVVGLQVGMLIVGSGIQAQTFVENISGSTVTMTKNATANLVASNVVFEHAYATGANVQVQLDQLDSAISALVYGFTFTVTANTGIGTLPGMIRSNSTSGNLTHTLPAIATVAEGWEMIVKDVGTGGHTTAVQGNGGELIDGFNVWASGPLSQYESATFRSNGVSWDVV
jgi:hypothetical protein